MKNKSKRELKKALARIMEKAKVCKDLAHFKSDQDTYEWIAKLAYEALDNPSMADVTAFIAGREPPQKKEPVA